jgi:hypothetical protein
MVIYNDSAGAPESFPAIEPTSVVFLQSFAADVQSYMSDVISSEWEAAHTSSKAVQS